jgi:hypothetical protein
MADRGEQPYDPYIPSGQPGAGGAAGAGAAAGGNSRTAALQAVSIPVARRVYERSDVSGTYKLRHILFVAKALQSNHLQTFFSQTLLPLDTQLPPPPS